MGRANALIIRFIDTPGHFDSRRNAAVVRRQLSATALTAPSREEARPRSEARSWMCGLGLSCAREVLLVRHDGETWSYCCSHPECAPTCQRRWSTPMKTETAGQDIR